MDSRFVNLIEKDEILKNNLKFIENDDLKYFKSSLKYSYDTNYSKMTMKELILLCKEKGIKGYSGKKKMEIINLLSVPTLVKNTDTSSIETNNAFGIQFTKNTNTIEMITTNFKKCIEGYHLINSSIINSTIWEDINTMIFSSSGIDIYSTSEGSHLSGMDINCSIGRMSNKSSKYSNKKKNFNISSYRLTTICNEKKYGTPTEIIKEINKRKNFDYYSIIVRDETEDEKISYDWLLIPSNYLMLEPSSYNWKPTIGKRKNVQIGWNTNEINGCKMSITFSMSSQLWIFVNMTEEIKKFIIASVTVEKKTKYNYINLIEKLNTK